MINSVLKLMGINEVEIYLAENADVISVTLPTVFDYLKDSNDEYVIDSNGEYIYH